MREILFRGKSVNDGNWVQGSLVVTTSEPADDAPIKHYHIEDMAIGVFPNEFQSGLDETVDPETVGQYTGIKDKHGKRIFEGDILTLRTGIPYVVRFEDGGFVLTGTAIPIHHADKFEVIGNIHDNPELMEE